MKPLQSLPRYLLDTDVLRDRIDNRTRGSFFYAHFKLGMALSLHILEALNSGYRVPENSSVAPGLSHVSQP